jgi:hypothetical protein
MFGYRKDEVLKRRSRRSWFPRLTGDLTRTLENPFSAKAVHPPGSNEKEKGRKHLPIRVIGVRSS